MSNFSLKVEVWSFDGIRFRRRVFKNNLSQRQDQQTNAKKNDFGFDFLMKDNFYLRHAAEHITVVGT
jgi:hypothetical protein